ncbi:blue (type 1) copper domain protein [Chthoniobacter flavus Ellin428]|uniref:Blue (Type 1) copper domain protein n=1 Tax=Chthoniobacter flavus Ellin428 TaxID=497964 RepID=B4D4T4_9BACT|nr:LamG-like jellyroll fold domain-containing protein [Chthoniobacter flavus]EDY18537.1 blue (type 1) copper domain protein [Chthoniobacter flavus Ellin428]TCO91007.1 copper binding plastocyanin/azurin family protein [Chthoniobacter flavus]
MLIRRFSSSVVLLLVVGVLVMFGGSVSAKEAEPIEIKAVSGLRYDPPRFVVKPGAKVKLEVENTDDMAHNFVIVAPGGRMEVVNAAMTMPVTPEQTFIPQSDKILFHTPVLIPGKSASLEFTAPTEEGVYPYICTYPGHGMVMFGAMYVTKQKEKDLPKVADDENLPELIREQAKNPILHAFPIDTPHWYRIFMRDSGPASIAVQLPDGQNYCWDAGACRLRYAWRGGFVDPMDHWRGNGDGFAEVKGTIYYRSTPYFPLRIGDEKKIPHDIRFRGYNIVDGLPEFHYQVDDVDVRELIKAAHHGGFEETFRITGTKQPVFFVTDPNGGAAVASEAGTFNNGVLKLPAAKAKEFTVTFMEILNKEPIGYWSMDDVLTVKKPLPVPGVKNRALIFDGKKAQHDTGLKSESFGADATFSIWVQLSSPPDPDQVCIGAAEGEGEFALGANIGGVSGYGVRLKSGKLDTKIVAAVPTEADGKWHHLAATLNAKGLRFYFDGKPAGSGAGGPLPPGAEFYLGSNGSTHFAAATLDEARIYARALDAKEIEAIYENERPKAPVSAPVKPTSKHAK